MNEKWKFLGKGSYNNAYINREKTLVLKIAKNSANVLDSPERSVRIWNEINPQKPATLSSINSWICPYIEGEQASDLDMMESVIDIYNRTGRIIVDAPSPKNFITQKDGTTICVDIGLAVQLESEEENSFTRRIRASSFDSTQEWSESKNLYPKYYQNCERHYPETVKTIKSLLYLRENCPLMTNVSFLLQSEYRDSISTVYDKGNLKQQPIDLPVYESPNLDQIKDSLINELNRYLAQRGRNIERVGEFKPFFWYKKQLTMQKAAYVFKLIDAIYDAKNLQEMGDVFLKIGSSVENLKGEGLKFRLNRCFDMLSEANKGAELEHSSQLRHK